MVNRDITLYGAEEIDWKTQRHTPYIEHHTTDNLGRLADSLTRSAHFRANFNLPYENEAGVSAMAVRVWCKSCNEEGYQWNLWCRSLESGKNFHANLHHYSDPYRVNIDTDWRVRGLFNHEEEPEVAMDNAREGALYILRRVATFAVVECDAEQFYNELMEHCGRTDEMFSYEITHEKQGVIGGILTHGRDEKGNIRTLRVQGSTRAEVCHLLLEQLK